MSESKQFIEVKRVLSDNLKNNTSTQPEVICVDLIDTFRGWHKGRNDIAIKGEMTLLVLKNQDKASSGEESDESKKEVKKIRTMLIEESYNDFLKRMSTRVIIRQLSDEVS